MAHKIKTSEIPAMRQKLEKWRLDCYNTYYLIKDCYKTEGKDVNLDIFVDNEDVTQLTSVVTVWEPDFKPAEKWYFVFTQDAEKLKILIGTPGVITITTDVAIHFHCEKSANQVVHDLVTMEMGLYPRVVYNMHAYIHSSLEVVREWISNTQIPTNFKITPLETRHAKMLQASREYDHPIDRYENIIKYCRNVAVYDDKGIPIAWVVVKEYGDIGMTYTAPGYRRQGFASFLTALITKEILDSDEIPFTKIEKHNEISIKMHTKLGFMKYSDVIFISV